MDNKTSRKKSQHPDKSMTHPDIFKEFNYECLAEQIGSDHYKKMKVEPAYFISENKLEFAEGNVVKYVCRHKYKNKSQDIKKAIHYLKIILERDYPNE